MSRKPCASTWSSMLRSPSHAARRRASSPSLSSIAASFTELAGCRAAAPAPAPPPAPPPARRPPRRPGPPQPPRPALLGGLPPRRNDRLGQRAGSRVIDHVRLEGRAPALEGRQRRRVRGRRRERRGGGLDLAHAREPRRVLQE